MEKQIFDFEKISAWQPDLDFRQLETLKKGRFLQHAPANILQIILNRISQFPQGRSSESVYNLNSALVEHFSRANPSWQLALSPDGKSLVICMDSILVVWRHERSLSKHGATTVDISSDSRQFLRKLTWSPDSKILAIAYSNGSLDLYNVQTRLIFLSIGPKMDIDCLNSIAGVFLRPLLDRDRDFDYQVNVVWADCSMKSFLLKCPSSHVTAEWNNEKSSKVWKCLFDHVFHCHSVITCLSFNHELDTLVIGGCGKYVEAKDGTIYPTSQISIWKLTQDSLSSYYNFQTGMNTEKSDTKTTGSLKKIQSKVNLSHNVITSFDVNWSLKQVIACDLHGNLYLWKLETDTPLKYEFDLENNVLNRWSSSLFKDKSRKRIPIEVKFWQDDKAFIGFFDRAFSIVALPLCTPCFTHDFGNPVIFTSDGNKKVGRINILSCEKKKAKAKLNKNGKITDLEILSGNAKTDKSWSLTEIWMFVMYCLRLCINVLLWHWEGESLTFRRNHDYFELREFSLYRLEEGTPKELFLKKINLGQFEKADSFAEKYGLDKSQIFKARWISSAISENSMLEFKEKITDRMWKLEQCSIQIAETPELQRSLLSYGLEISELAVDSLKGDFDEESIGVIKYRRTLVGYLDRLNTWEKVQLIDGKSSYTFKKNFKFFRDADLVEITLFYASNEFFELVRLFCEIHTEELRPFRYQILDAIPKSSRLRDFSFLLPKIQENREFIDIMEHGARKRDWSDSDDLLKKVPLDKGVSTGTTYPQDISFVQEWYYKRILAIDQNTGLIDRVLEMLDHAKYQGLEFEESLVSNLKFYLEYLTSNDIDDSELTLIDFSEFSQMTPSARISFISKRGLHKAKTSSKHDLLVQDLKKFIIPAANTFSIDVKEVFSQFAQELRAYDPQITFDIMKSLIHRSLPVKAESLIHDVDWLSEVLCSCIEDLSSSLYPSAVDLCKLFPKSLLNTKRMIDRLKICINFSKLKINVNLQDIEQFRNDNKTILALIKKAARQGQLLEVEDAQLLWNNFADLIKHMEIEVDISLLYQTLLIALLLNNDIDQIDLVKHLLFGTLPLNNFPQLTSCEIDKVILTASREYSDNDLNGNITQPPLDFAMKCLKLVPESELQTHKAIQKEIRFLQAVHRICVLSGIKSGEEALFPYKIRMMNDKISLVMRALQRRSMSLEEALQTCEYLISVDFSLNENLSDCRLQVCKLAFDMAINANDLNKASYCLDRSKTFSLEANGRGNGLIMEMILTLLNHDNGQNTLNCISFLGDLLSDDNFNDRLLFLRVSNYFRKERLKLRSNFINENENDAQVDFYRIPFYSSVEVDSTLSRRDFALQILVSLNKNQKLEQDSAIAKAVIFLLELDMVDPTKLLSLTGVDILRLAFSFKDFRQKNEDIFDIFDEETLNRLITKWIQARGLADVTLHPLLRTRRSITQIVIRRLQLSSSYKQEFREFINNENLLKI